MTPTLNLQLPRSWSELTRAQLFYAYFLKHAGRFSPAEVRALCLLRFGHLSRDRMPAPRGFVRLRQGRRSYCVPTVLLGVAADTLSYLDGLPDTPVRLEEWEGCPAASPMLYEVDFGTYLLLENYWQSFLRTKDEKAIDRMSLLLYKGLSPKKAAHPILRYAVACWMAALKEQMAARFGHLFRPAGSEGDDLPDMEKVMNAELRALTGGDVTREAEVRAVGLWRALEELNAKAREAEELNRHR